MPLPPILIFLLLTVALSVPVILLFRKLWHRDLRRQQQVARRRWRLAEILALRLQETQLPESADLLYLARAEAGLTLERVRLRQVVQKSLSRMLPALERAGYELRSHEGGDPYARADPAALGHALDSLLRLESVGQGSILQIQLSTERTWAVLEVMGGQGTGQASAIAIRIIEAHGGDMRVQDRRVTLRLPLVS